MSSICIFLGPTLPVDYARAVLDAVYLPPAAGGDVYEAVRRFSPRIIGLVDGELERAVRHKELLDALSRGIHVFGAASFGALRAAELFTFGMIGVGRVFEDYLSGRTEDDDDVVVDHAAAELGYRAWSEAMVNIRHALQLAREQGAIGAEAARIIEARAKKLFYAERSWGRVFEEARRAGVTPRELSALRHWLLAVKPNLKRDDVLLLLEQIAERSVEA